MLNGGNVLVAVGRCRIPNKPWFPVEVSDKAVLSLNPITQAMRDIKYAIRHTPTVAVLMAVNVDTGPELTNLAVNACISSNTAEVEARMGIYGLFPLHFLRSGEDEVLAG